MIPNKMHCIARSSTPPETPSWLAAVLTSITQGQTLFLVDSYDDDGAPIPSFSFRYDTGDDLSHYLINEIRTACLLVNSGAFSMYIADPVGSFELDDHALDNSDVSDLQG